MNVNISGVKYSGDFSLKEKKQKSLKKENGKEEQ